MEGKFLVQEWLLLSLMSVDVEALLNVTFSGGGPSASAGASDTNITSNSGNGG